MAYLILIVLFLCCSGPGELVQDRHTFYAGSIKDGQDILKMYDWRCTKIDTLRDASGTSYLFHYRELELK
jgi:hypothetical protein